MRIAENILRIKEEIPPHVKLTAVSKTHPVEIIEEAFRAGQVAFGENKAQEMIRKQTALPNDIAWHFIGHLQTNKVKQVVKFVHFIESVDSFKLLREINKRAENVNRQISCLLQFHIASEESKFGFDVDEASAMLEDIEYKEMQNIRIKGVMGMATFTENTKKIRKEFRDLYRIFTDLKNKYFACSSDFTEISMGMSGDYKIAIEEGSTMVRLGSAIFGMRNY